MSYDFTTKSDGIWTILEGEEGHAFYVTPLNATQRHILELLGLPDDLYGRLKQSLDNLVLHLRE